MITSTGDWGPVEPAHPTVVKLYDDLVAIYSYIKENFQKEIDAAFERASEGIGFVVATTIPIAFEIGEKGTIDKVSVTSEQLKGTAFDKELSRTLNSMKSGKLTSTIAPGSYNLVLFWYDAVKLRLKTDWMEPAHTAYGLKSELMGIRDVAAETGTVRSSYVRQSSLMAPAYYKPWCEPAHWHRPWYEPAQYYGLPYSSYEIQPVFRRTSEAQVRRLRPEPQEPAHSIDRERLMAMEKNVLISAIDEAYPDLKLGERLSRSQQAVASVTASVTQPSGVAMEPSQPISEIIGVLNKYGYAMVSPMHQPPTTPTVGMSGQMVMSSPVPQPVPHPMIAEMAKILSRYGYAMFTPVPEPPAMPAGYSGAVTGITQPQPMFHQALAEITEVLRRYGAIPINIL